MILDARSYFHVKALSTFFYSEAARPASFRSIDLTSLNAMITNNLLAFDKIRGNMVKSKKTKKPVFKWLGYANISIPNSMSSQCEARIKDEKSVMEFFSEMQWLGYTFKFYADKASESIKVTCTCYVEDSPNFGWALSAYAGNWYTALAVLTFKHYDIAKENWTDFDSETKQSYG